MASYILQNPQRVSEFAAKTFFYGGLLALKDKLFPLMEQSVRSLPCNWLPVFVGGNLRGLLCDI